ncbi:MAG: C40 family peptidase [Cyclobacteriaceae bacterium]
MEVIDFGVSRLALIPVRKDADNRSEQSSQLLFGDHYEVLDTSKDKEWLYIRIFADKYEGWINVKQHHSISSEYFNQINYANYKITTDLASGILYKKSPLTVLMGSIVPISNSELFKMEEQFAFNGESKSLGQKRDFDFLKSIALKYIHAPYQWGGKSPFGIDCSGFTQMTFKICGYPISRDASEQKKCGKEVDGFGNALPGDLAFFSDTKGTVTHVGIILEEEKIAHASGQVKIDVLVEDGIIDTETKVITHFLSHIRRILPES